MAAGAAAAAAVVGQLAGAAGGILSNKKTGVSTKKLPPPPITNANPVMNQQLLEYLLASGSPIDQSLLMQASPLGQLLSNRRSNKGLDQLHQIVTDGISKGLSIDEIASQVEASGITKKNEFSQLLARSGYGSLGDLIGAEQRFSQSATQRTGILNQLQPHIQQGRFDALSKIADLQSGFVAPSQQGITDFAKQQEDILRAQIARERGDQQNALLEQASALGINPAARLGRLDEWQAQSNLEAGTQGLARALQLLGGQQGLQTNALGALQGSLAPAQNQGQNLLNTQLSLGQLAAQQAMGLAGLNAQNTQANSNLLASGLGNAGNIFSQYMFMQNNPDLFGGGTKGQLGQLMQLLSGGGYSGGLPGGQAAAPFSPDSLDQYAGLIRH